MIPCVYGELVENVYRHWQSGHICCQWCAVELHNICSLVSQFPNAQKIESARFTCTKAIAMRNRSMYFCAFVFISCPTKPCFLSNSIRSLNWLIYVSSRFIISMPCWNWTRPNWIGLSKEPQNVRKRIFKYIFIEMVPNIFVILVNRQIDISHISSVRTTSERYEYLVQFSVFHILFPKSISQLDKK